MSTERWYHRDAGERGSFAWIALAVFVILMVIVSSAITFPQGKTAVHASSTTPTNTSLSTTVGSLVSSSSLTSPALPQNILASSRLLGMSLPRWCLGAFNMSTSLPSTCEVQDVFNLSHLRIAVAMPVFTTTAYNSFYRFYALHPNLSKNETVTQDLNLLNASVIYDWGESSGLYSFLTSQTAIHSGIVVGKNLFVVNDIQVNNGALFNSTTDQRNYDVVILGFTEYVSQQEYSSLKQFVSDGGRLIIMSGCSFLARVTYDASAGTVILDEGHGYYFNGTAARGGVYNYFAQDNTNWVGSNYGPLFGSHGYYYSGAVANTSNPLSAFMRNATNSQRVILSYYAHEENAMTNSTDNVIAYWPIQLTNPSAASYVSGKVVATYEHDYGKGMVIHMGVFGTDIIGFDAQCQLLLLAAIGMPSYGPRA